MVETRKPLVLVVEDEPLIRLDIVLAFLEAGFAVIEGSDADAALALLDAHADIGLVFTDVELPSALDGLALAAHIKRLRPALPVVITSGRVRETGAGDLFIPKPYDPEEVISQARALAA